VKLEFQVEGRKKQSWEKKEMDVLCEAGVYLLSSPQNFDRALELFTSFNFSPAETLSCLKSQFKRKGLSRNFATPAQARVILRKWLLDQMRDPRKTREILEEWTEPIPDNLVEYSWTRPEILQHLVPHLSEAQLTESLFYIVRDHDFSPLAINLFLAGGNLEAVYGRIAREKIGLEGAGAQQWVEAQIDDLYREFGRRIG